MSWMLDWWLLKRLEPVDGCELIVRCFLCKVAEIGIQ